MTDTIISIEIALTCGHTATVEAGANTQSFEWCEVCIGHRDAITQDNLGAWTLVDGQLISTI